MTEGDSSEEEAPKQILKHVQIEDSSVTEPTAATSSPAKQASLDSYAIDGPPIAKPAPATLMDDRQFCVHISNSQDLLEDSPKDKVSPAVADDEPEVTIIETTVDLRTASPGEMDFLRRLSHLDAAFPPPVRGEFQPSEFQRAVLDDMQGKRQKFGHKHGLSIMATAVGKVHALRCLLYSLTRSFADSTCNS